LIGQGADSLGPLAHNGGPTLTHALLPGSPAINAGDPAAMAGVDGVPLFDQRGEPFTRVYGGRIDIGAFEWQPNPLAGDYNFDGTVDAADYVVWQATRHSAVDLRANGNGDRVVDQADYDVWWANFGSSLALQMTNELKPLHFASAERAHENSNRHTPHIAAGFTSVTSDSTSIPQMFLRRSVTAWPNDAHAEQTTHQDLLLAGTSQLGGHDDKSRFPIMDGIRSNKHAPDGNRRLEPIDPCINFLAVLRTLSSTTSNSRERFSLLNGAD
jgi:hypothetical protein